MRRGPSRNADPADLAVTVVRVRVGGPQGEAGAARDRPGDPSWSPGFFLGHLYSTGDDYGDQAGSSSTGDAESDGADVRRAARRRVSGTSSGEPLEPVQRPTDALRVDPQSLPRSEEHTSELQSRLHLVCRLLLEKKNRGS